MVSQVINNNYTKFEIIILQSLQPLLSFPSGSTVPCNYWESFVLRKFLSSNSLFCIKQMRIWREKTPSREKKFLGSTLNYSIIGWFFFRQLKETTWCYGSGLGAIFTFFLSGFLGFEICNFHPVIISVWRHFLLFGFNSNHWKKYGDLSACFV